MITCTDEMPLECKHFDKKIPQNTTLSRHLKTHIGMKPYLCNQGDKAFLISHYLRKYIRIHTAEQPYQCNKCEKKSRREKTYNKSNKGLRSNKVKLKNVSENDGKRSEATNKRMKVSNKSLEHLSEPERK